MEQYGITHQRHWEQIIDDAFDRVMAQRVIKHDDPTIYDMYHTGYRQNSRAQSEYKPRVNRDSHDRTWPYSCE